jgi:membrane protease YdiL (CAAX protease family)
MRAAWEDARGIPVRIRASAGVFVSHVWQQLPAVVRALIASALIGASGPLVQNALAAANLRTTPAIPWGAAATLVWLVLLWRWLGGWGWPASTSELRHTYRGAEPMGPDTWRWALFAAAFAAVSFRALLDVLRRLSPVPSADLIPAEQLAGYPAATILALLLAAAISAGVVEEVAFRGYLQRMIEPRHGATVAIAVSSLAFAFAHWRWGAPDPRQWLAFTPAYFACGIGLGALAYFSRSIVPGILAHATIDAIGLIQYWRFGPPASIWISGFDAAFAVRCAVAIAAGAVAVLAVARLARMSEPEWYARG